MSLQNSFSYLTAAVQLAEALDMDEADARNVAHKLVANRYLEKSSGRRIVAPKISGLAFLCSALIARSLGMPIEKAVGFAHQADGLRALLSGDGAGRSYCQRYGAFQIIISLDAELIGVCEKIAREASQTSWPQLVRTA